MRALQASPKKIREIFEYSYIIPDFQRPYSWEREQCEKLWEDLLSFYEEQSATSISDKYFLGNLVVVEHSDDKLLDVIDGQQRLTTLLLLIKALHIKAGTVKALEECLRKKDPLTSELTNDLRIDSAVVAKDKFDLADIIFNDGRNIRYSSKLKDNFDFFVEKLTDWWRSVDQRTEKLNNLILTILDFVVLLPIQCGSEDDALIIFETINNRGMSLTDADIFKAKLYHAAESSNDLFMKRWNSLHEHEWLFRIYMHILRAKDDDTSKEVGLRTFFSNNDRLRNWDEVMSSLELIDNANYYWNATEEIDILWYILYTYPNQYWNFPLFVYLHKYGRIVDESLYLDPSDLIGFENLLKSTFKYFFLKGVVHNSVNSVKDTVYKVCACIEREQDFNDEYEKSSNPDLQEFHRRIEKRQYGRYINGLVLLTAYLNPEQHSGNFRNLLKNKYHIEHILPKKWNNYDGWSNETWSENLNSLGNLVPLESSLNISARNEFFNRKKNDYEISKVQDAKDLIAFDDWHPKQFSQRHLQMQERIFRFFDISIS